MRLLIPFFVLISTAPAFAESDIVVVTANRSAQPLSRVGQTITIIDTAEIRQRQSNTVADLLRGVPGVSIARNGGIGGVTSVFIRGAESDQTVTLIDGVKINDPAAPGSGFNFGNLLTGNIDHIEVLRGAQSVLWGSQAIGGVVNMITAAPTETLLVNARTETGYRGTAQAVANVSGKYGPLSASVGGGYFRTDGISAFNEDRGGKERDGYENHGANAKFNLALTDAISLDLRGYYSSGKANTDGFAPPTYAFGDTQDTTKTRELIGYAGLNAAFLDGRFRNRIGYAITDIRRRNFDGAGFENFAGTGRNQRIEYQGGVQLAKGWDTTFGIERETSRYNTASFGALSKGRARIDSVYGQLVASPISGVTLTAGVRHDDHDRFGGKTTFGGSGVFSPNNGATTLRASYSEGFKAPSLYQLQGDYGNQSLRPETSNGYDVGLTQKLLVGGIEASATWFHRDSKDLINFISCPTPRAGICAGRPFGTYDNVAKARAQGIELALLLRPVDALTVRAAYGYVDARNRTQGTANFDKRLARRPSQIVNASADYHWAHGVDTGVTITQIGRSFDNASNSVRLAAYVLTDIRASFDVSRQISIYGRVDNLFGERYETAALYGSLGRAAYAGLRLRY